MHKKLGKETIKKLVAKFRDNTISADELHTLYSLLKEENSEQDLGELYEKLEDRDVEQAKELGNTNRILDKILLDDRILAERKELKSYKIRKLTLRILSASAACIALFFLWKLTTPYSGFEMKATPAMVSNTSPIVPGSNKARIMLSDGSVLDLETLKNDTTIQLDGFAIHKDKAGSVKYINYNLAEQELVYNTIITPAGGQYQLELYDGTTVLINASSTLKYPIRFSSKSREVSLHGEAYFEVAKQQLNGQRVSFIVSTGRQKIEVLGTAFNVNSYKKDIKTTLIEGAVRLSYTDSKISKLLKPNEQAVYVKESHQVNIKTVDPFYTMAWKDGAFAFENTSINDVMEEIARWYNVEVEYKQDMSQVFFTGTISKYEDISKLLNTIGLTGSVKFKIAGRRILVMR